MSTCVVGVPKERKQNEGRVGMTPKGVSLVVEAGGDVIVESGAGLLAGFSDSHYLRVGATVASHQWVVWGAADILVKVKEPIPEEYPYLAAMRGKTLFAYLHLAGSEKALTEALLRNRVTSIAYETVSVVGVGGRVVFPLLVPMSKIAGTESMKAALLRHKHEDVAKLTAVIIGGGNVGEAALVRALECGIGLIILFETWEPKMRELVEKYGSEKVFIFPMAMLNHKETNEFLRVADIFISAPMLPGGQVAPVVLTKKHFDVMKEGAYISDVSIDQGGSTDYTRWNPTKPGETFIYGTRKLVLSAVPNIPGSTVPEEATRALCAATEPYIVAMVAHHLAHQNDFEAMRTSPSLRAGLQTWRGWVTNEHVMTKHGLCADYFPLNTVF